MIWIWLFHFLHLKTNLPLELIPQFKGIIMLTNEMVKITLREIEILPQVQTYTICILSSSLILELF